MDERQFEDVFRRFLDGYWGAFHELIEAESVRPDRLASFLFLRVVDQHARFAAVAPDPVKRNVDALGRLWRQVLDHRRIVPDGALTAEQVHQALGQFSTIYDRLCALGRHHATVRDSIEKRAAHATPRAPLRADAAS
jgi:hypothetical protein